MPSWVTEVQQFLAKINAVNKITTASTLNKKRKICVAPFEARHAQSSFEGGEEGHGCI